MMVIVGYYCCGVLYVAIAMWVMQCSFSVCLKSWDENQDAVDEFADQWRVRAADPATGDPADPFDCFYDVSDPRRVIPHKTYSRADVVHCMLWPSLVVVASAVTFLYLEARRSRLTFCGRRPSGAADGEKSQLKPASSSSSSSAAAHHSTKAAKQQEHAVNDADRHHHGMKPTGAETTSKVCDLYVPRQKDGRHLGGQVRSSIDVSVAATSPGAADSPSSRRARRPHEHRTAAAKSHSVSSLTAAVDAEAIARPAGSGAGRRTADDASSGRRRLCNRDKLVGTLDSTPGRCVSESRLDTAI